MPELPEVEIIAQGLNQALFGQRVASVELFWPSVVAQPAPEMFTTMMVGRRFHAIWRRGKYLVFELDGGHHLLAHLRMTGSFCLTPRSEPIGPHVRALFGLEEADSLIFSDVRKFGRLYLVEGPEQLLGRLGPEPSDPHLSAERFTEMLTHRRSRIKPLLLNQCFLAGLGNIYVDEALFRAGIYPLRNTHSMNDEECSRLLAAIRSVLEEGIARRGTTLNNYRDAQGRQGRNQDYLKVYGKAGAPCPCCETPIERIVVSGRGTHYCPHCQPANHSTDQ